MMTYIFQIRNRYFIYVLLIIFFVNVRVVPAQTHATDSLCSIYKQSKGAGRLKAIYNLIETNDIPYSLVGKLSLEALELCNNDTALDKRYAFYLRGVYFYRVNNDSSTYYFNKIIKQGIQNRKEILVKSYYLLIKTRLYIENNIIQANNVLTKMDSLFKNNPGYADYGTLYESKGYYYSRLNKIDTALQYFLKADSVYKEADSTISRFKLQQTISFLYFTLGNYSRSSGYLTNINSIDESKMGADEKAYFYFNFMVHLKKLDIDFEKQLNLCRKTVKLYEYLQDSTSQVFMMVPLGKLYLHNKQYDTALSIFKKALALNKKINNNINRAQIMYNLFNLYMKIGKEKTAIRYADTAMILFRKLNTTSLLRELQLNLAGYYLKNGNMQTAALYFDTVKRFLEKNDFNSIRLSYNKLYSMYQANLGNYPLAFNKMKKYAFDIDSIKSSELQNKLSNLYAIYKTRKKEKENTILKQKLIIEKQKKIQHEKSRRTAVIISIITAVLFIVTAVLFIVFRKSMITQRLLNLEKLRRAEQTNRLLEQEKIQASEKLKAHNELVKVMNNQLLYQALISSKLIEELKMLKEQVNYEAQVKIQTVLAEFKSFSASQNWINFEKNFIKIFPGVQEIIKKEVPDLSTGDFRVLCFLIMRLSNREISMITLQSNSSLRSATFRLRKKFNVETNDQLIDKIDQLTGGKISNSSYNTYTANH